MQIDIRDGGLEKRGDVNLCQPERVILQPTLDARAPIFRLVKEEFAAGRGSGWKQVWHRDENNGGRGGCKDGNGMALSTPRPAFSPFEAERVKLKQKKGASLLTRQ